MGERRSRKSWNTEEETHRHSGMSEHDSFADKERQYRNPSGRYREYAASGTTFVPKSRDRSGWSSWDSIEENPPALKSRHNAVEGKEVGGGNRYRNGFDGKERRHYDQTLENDRMDPYRYPGRDRNRSRSRSRSRTRGRSRSRSLSRRGGKERGGGWSRSRSRSRSGGNARGRTRSRSPLGYRSKSSRGDDRKSVTDKSSQVCKDFAGGICRRGSHCRFFHPDNPSHTDGDFMEDGPTEIWRKQADHGRTPKRAFTRGPGFELRDGDVSDRYHGEDEKFSRKSRNAVPCKDFAKGNCRWGDTCKFSHHLGSDSSSGKYSRNASFDEDVDFPENKISKPLCKYFAAGKCGRDNCRFSHEDPSPSHVEDSRGTSHQRSNDKRNSWDGPTWDDATTSDTVKTTGWVEPCATKTSDAIDNRKDDGRWAHSLRTDRESPDLPEWTGPSLDTEKQPSPTRETATYGRDADMTASIDKENMVNRQEHLLLHHPEVQNQNTVLNVQGLHVLLEAQTHSLNPLQQNVPAQQYHQEAENNLFNSNSHDVHTNAACPVLSSEANLNQNGESMIPGHSSVPNEKDGGANMLTTASAEFMLDLIGHEKRAVTPLSLNAMQNHIVDVQSSQPQLFHNFFASQQSSEMTNPVPISGQQVPNPSVVLSQRFGGEQSINYAGVEVSNSTGSMPSISDNLGHTDLVNTIKAQPVPIPDTIPDTLPVRVSHDQCNRLENGRDADEFINVTLAQGVEPKSQIHVEQSPPVVPMELESPKAKMVEVVTISEVNGGTNAVGEEDKSMQESRPSETLDFQGKVEGISVSKDEKGMRMLKNALVELVKEILKPKWKEGRMSKEVHKTIVKKVVDKVMGTIQGDHVPKTHDKVEQYLLSSKPKISKLVQAYVERCMKADS